MGVQTGASCAVAVSTGGKDTRKSIVGVLWERVQGRGAMMAPTRFGKGRSMVQI